MAYHDKVNIARFEKEPPQPESSAALVCVPDHLKELAVGPRHGDVDLAMVDLVVPGIHADFKVPLFVGWAGV